MNSAIKGRDVKQPKFRAGAPGYSKRSRCRGEVIHLGKVVGHVLEFCVCMYIILYPTVDMEPMKFFYNWGDMGKQWVTTLQSEFWTHCNIFN